MPAQKTLHRCFCFGRPVSSCQKFLNTHRRRLYTTAYAMAEAVTSTQDNLDTSQPAPEAAADTVLVVESPTKATKVQKYLGPEFKVLASYGHIRDLPSKDGAVDPSANFKMTWAVGRAAGPRLDAIKLALKQTSIKRLVLATDPDREGEAIAWHLLEELKKSVKGKAVERIKFTEVTKKAVEEALHNPRAISQAVVESYKARRALDFLVGFGISPVLWRKVSGSKSAGRVQSVALRLLAERETEREAFKPDAWWTVDVTLTNALGQPFQASVTHVDGKRLHQYELKSEAEAQALGKRVAEASLQITGVRGTEVEKGPSAPYMTSTMLTDAANQLGSNVARTMANAQALFEGGDADGLISYMRSDSSSLDDDSAHQLCEAVAAIFGPEFVTDPPKQYKTDKQANVQEGHGAIVPVDPMNIPEDVFKFMAKVKGASPTTGLMTPSQRKLYDLVWRRALSSQMAVARLKQVSAEISSVDGSLKLRSSATQVLFPGFMKAYDDFQPRPQEQNGEEEEQHGSRATARRLERDKQARLLSNLKAGEVPGIKTTPSTQHFTKAAPQYTEAQLVKTLKEKGIGRPSTYAPIISVLQLRGYAVKEGRALRVTSRGRMVSTYLVHYFPKYVDYNFTSDMEAQLDEIAAGTTGHTQLLQQFWPEFDALVQSSGEVSVRETIDVLDADLAPHFFPPQEGETEEAARACPACTQRGEQGQLGLKPGGFIGCSSYPNCSYSRPLELVQQPCSSSSDEDEDEEELFPGLSEGPISLGRHPTTGEDILLRLGPYGHYLQLGTESSPSAVRKTNKGTRKTSTRQTTKKTNFKPRTAPLKRADLSGLDLERAIELLQWPLLLGEHSDLKDSVFLHLGMYGHYFQVGNTRVPVLKEMKPEEVDLEMACKALDAKQVSDKSKRRKYGGSSSASRSDTTGLDAATHAASDADDTAIDEPLKIKSPKEGPAQSRGANAKAKPKGRRKAATAGKLRT